MSWLDGVAHRLRTLLRPGRHAQDLEEEVQFHLEVEEMHQGPDAARRQFGNRTYYKEEARQMTWLRFVDRLRQDAGSAWRSLVRTPGITLVVAGVLAVGIGANAAAFTLLDTLYLKPPSGVADPGSVRRYWIRHFNSGLGVPFTSMSVSYPEYRLLGEASGSPKDLALYSYDWSRRVGAGFDGPRVRIVFASSSYFPVLGVKPELGRFYSEREDALGQPTNVVVISHSFWQRHFGGTRSVLGSPLDIGRTRYTVIGVADPAFTGLDLQAADAWVPLAAYEQPRWLKEPWWESKIQSVFFVVQRWAPSLNQAVLEARATTLLRSDAREIRARYRPDTLMTVHLGPILEVQGPTEPGQELIISSRLSAVAAVVLVIALANVINLLLARAVNRRREIALRLALGLSRGRLIGILTLEAVMIAVLAGSAAMLIAWGGGSLLRTLVLPDIEWFGSAVGWRVGVVTLVVALGCGLLGGLVPAIQASRPKLGEALKAGRHSGGRHRSRLRDSLVVVQAAFSMTLLVGAALFVRSLHNVTTLDIGFDVDRLVFGEVAFGDAPRPPQATLDATLRDVATRLRGRPGVATVARASMTPMQGLSSIRFYTGTDSISSFKVAPVYTSVSPEYFAATGLRLLKGRGFPGKDGDGAAGEIVVNEEAAKVIWPGKDPLGQCMRLDERNAPCWPVVGVVETGRLTFVIEPPRPQFYVPLAARPGDAGWSLIVRAEPEGFRDAAALVRGELQAVFPLAKVYSTPMRENLEPEYRPWKLGATLFTLFGVLALLVALVGIYSTVSYGVSQRTHEFGVRVALGALVADVVRQVVGEGLRVVAFGVVVGVGLAFAQGKIISALLYGVSPGNGVVLAGVSVVLLAVAALAAMLPAWRASRVDPVTVLRAD